MRQSAARTLKTQCVIGKEYHEKPWGEKAKYAASSPYAETVLQKYAKKYLDVKTTGKRRDCIS